jgi:hypothetical protein
MRGFRGGREETVTERARLTLENGDVLFEGGEGPTPGALTQQSRIEPVIISVLNTEYN